LIATRPGGTGHPDRSNIMTIITYIIGTNDIGIGPEEIENVEAYRDEVQAKLADAFPQAEHIDVVIENGNSQAFIKGVDDLDEEDAMLKRVTRIADEVWNHGSWHNV